MEIIRGMHNLRAQHQGCALTIGNFDGVHLGHQALLAQLKRRAQALGVPTLLVTFEPQPREYFQGQAASARLTRLREKLSLLAQCHLDKVLLLPFNQRLANWSATAMIDDLLLKGLGVRGLLVGDDFRFGRQRQGDITLLQQAARRHGFVLDALDTCMADAQRVSSTRIRQVLEAGDILQAERLLGHGYFIMGRVVKGRQLGKSLGTPTANIALQRYRAAVSGVFAVQVEMATGELAPGVANIGIRPTVGGRQPLLEVHVLDRDGDLYGASLTVWFRQRIRSEQKFASLDALRGAISQDISNARRYLQQLAPGRALGINGGLISTVGAST